MPGIRIWVCTASVALAVATSFAQGHSFTYQGRLDDGGRAANGVFDFRFSAWTDESGGSVVAGPSTNLAVVVNNGLFSCSVDFGATFDGAARWIELAVRTNGGSEFFNLQPRQAVTPTPYAIHAGSVSAGGIAPGTITSNMLAPGAAAGNLAQSGHSAVPASAVVFSTEDNDTNLLASGYLRMGGYVAAENLWRERNSQLAPSPRTGHAAVWTGSRMIVWGGRYGNDNPDYPPASAYFTDGGIYTHTNGAWAGMSSNGAPRGRESFTAVWSGTELLVWGGYYYNGSYNYFGDGARYNPQLNAWSPMSTNGAPSARYKHTAVWTGTEMIVWGGMSSSSGGPPWVTFNDGARYNPATDTWSPVTLASAPLPRMAHVAAWTGSDMLVWGGQGGDVYRSDGGRYNPVTDSWRAISTTNNPGSGRRAVWTGKELIVWECGGVLVGTAPWGGRYNPNTDSWTAIQQTLAPVARQGGTVVWTGREVLVWGGENSAALNDGAAYDPNQNAWTTLGISPSAPSPRLGHSAVWTGSEMLVFGGTDRSRWFADLWSCVPPKPLYLYTKE